MTEDAVPAREQLERELQYYRAEYNALGARMVRMQEQHSQISREARRSKLVARLVREAYAIGSWDLGEDTVGEPILSIVADPSICDQAILFVQEPDSDGVFRIEHAYGAEVRGSLNIGEPPDFLFTCSAVPAGAVARCIAQFVGVSFLLWAYNAASGRALLLGKRTESNIHRAFEGGDREIVEVALAVYEDVLLRKRAETALHEARIVAEETNNARSRFLANFSHELRTPLNAIVGFARLLMQRGSQTRPPAESEEYARLILDAGESLGALATDILDFSHLSHGEPQLRTDWVPINYLFRNAERSVSAQSVRSGIAIEVEPSVKGLQAAIDYDRFRQVLSNLLNNALKFTQAGGRVVMSAELGVDNGIVLTVRDNGIGIKAEDLPRIMQPFVQLNGSTRGSLQGVGLGLPIALQLVEAHGGKMLIESVYGEGTAVIISLPAHITRVIS